MRAAGLVLLAALALAAPAHAEIAAPAIPLDARPDGTLTGANGGESHVSGNGRYAVTSTSAALVGSDTNGTYDVYRRDLATGKVELVSKARDGDGGGNAASFTTSGPSVSYDGRFITWISLSSNLTAVVSGQQNVFVRDMQTGTTELVSISASGTTGGDGFSTTPRITPDGRYIAFASAANNLGSGSNTSFMDIFVRDRLGNTTRLVSKRPGNFQDAGNADSSAPMISDDGRIVAFESDATNISPVTDGNGGSDVFRRDMGAQDVQLVSVNSAGGATAGGESSLTDMTPDGRYVAFSSLGPNVTTLPDANGFRDVFRRDFATGATSVLSANAAGTATGNHLSADAVLSDDGRRAAFQSFATDLGAPGLDAAGAPDVFVRDVATAHTRLVSTSHATGRAANAPSGSPEISPNGRFLLFHSSATDLLPDVDSNGVEDIYRYDTQRGAMRLISVSYDRRTAVGGGFSVLRPNGDVSFVSEASTLTPPGIDTGGNNAFLVRNRAPSGATLAVAPATGTAPLSVRFSAGGRDLETAVSFRHSFGDGARAAGPSATHVYARPGTYRATATVTDADGATATTSRTIVVRGPAGGETDARPSASRFGMARRKFAVGRDRTPVSARAKRGSAFRYTLSEAARVRISIARRTTGRRAGRRCVKRTRKNAKRRKCTRYVRAGTLTRAGQAGANRHAFSGRIGRRKLKPGRYRATLLATDAAGQRSTARRVTFTIVRR